tara:strand:- start:1690 stop:1902 length:213 start_codon:yes stop_codon:yes gene_type:complete
MAKYRDYETKIANIRFLDKLAEHYGSNEKMANAIGINVRTIYNWRSGTKIPKASRLLLERELEAIEKGEK